MDGWSTPAAEGLVKGFARWTRFPVYDQEAHDHLRGDDPNLPSWLRLVQLLWDSPMLESLILSDEDTSDRLFSGPGI
jgi:hypothetical protein